MLSTERSAMAAYLGEAVRGEESWHSPPWWSSRMLFIMQGHKIVSLHRALALGNGSHHHSPPCHGVSWLSPLHCDFIITDGENSDKNLLYAFIHMFSEVVSYAVILINCSSLNNLKELWKKALKRIAKKNKNQPSKVELSQRELGYHLAKSLSQSFLLSAHWSSDLIKFSAV